MKIVKIVSIGLFVGVVGFLTVPLAPPAFADPPQIFSALQDEAQELPADNAAVFFASREVSVRLDLLAAVGADTSDTLVTVVRPNGQTTELSPDDDGMVRLANVEEGPHAFVANSRIAHGTTLLDLNQNDGVEPLEEPEPTRLTMLKLRAKNLRPIVDELRDVGVDQTLVSRSEPLRQGNAFDYRVRLGADGTLYGQVISVLDESQYVSLEGTHIIVYRDGQPIGSTYADFAGMFSIAGIGAGVHGLTASGRAGYAAMAFEAINPGDVVMTNANGESFVALQDGIVDRLPVVLAPPPMVPAIIKSISDYYPTIDGAAADPAAGAPPLGQPIASPFGGAMVPSGPGGGFGGGGGGFAGGGGGSGLGGLLGIAAIGGVIAATSDDDNNVIQPPVVASPALPMPAN